MIHPSQFLRRALLADAVFSGIAAMVLTLDAGALAPLLALPEALLRETGLFLIAYTGVVGWLGTRQTMPKILVSIVIAGNIAWTVASIALLFSGAVLTEATFNWPGIGHELIFYLENRDYTGVQGIIVFFALVVVFFSLMIDLASAAIDPRIRY